MKYSFIKKRAALIQRLCNNPTDTKETSQILKDLAKSGSALSGIFHLILVKMKMTGSQEETEFKSIYFVASSRIYHAMKSRTPESIARAVNSSSALIYYLEHLHHAGILHELGISFNRPLSDPVKRPMLRMGALAMAIQ